MSVSPLGSSKALSGIQQRGTEGRQRDNADCGTTMQRVLALAELLVLLALSMICTPPDRLQRGKQQCLVMAWRQLLASTPCCPCAYASGMLLIGCTLAQNDALLLKSFEAWVTSQTCANKQLLCSMPAACVRVAAQGVIYIFVGRPPALACHLMQTFAYQRQQHSRQPILEISCRVTWMQA